MSLPAPYRCGKDHVAPLAGQEGAASGGSCDCAARGAGGRGGRDAGRGQCVGERRGEGQAAEEGEGVGGGREVRREGLGRKGGEEEE